LSFNPGGVPWAEAEEVDNRTDEVVSTPLEAEEVLLVEVVLGPLWPIRR
jgi:hypothetical protein